MKKEWIDTTKSTGKPIIDLPQSLDKKLIEHAKRLKEIGIQKELTK